MRVVSLRPGLFFHSEGLLLLLGNRHDDAALADVGFQLRRNATALDALLNTSRVEDIVNITSNGAPLLSALSACLTVAQPLCPVSSACSSRSVPCTSTRCSPTPASPRASRRGARAGPIRSSAWLA